MNYIYIYCVIDGLYAINAKDILCGHTEMHNKGAQITGSFKLDTKKWCILEVTSRTMLIREKITIVV